MPPIAVVSPDQRQRCVDTLVRAFATDVAARWMYPDPEQYRQWFSEFVLAFGGAAFEIGTAHVIGPMAGAALWMPPDAQADDSRLATLIENSVDPALKGEAFALFEQMETLFPREPVWHLPLIGVTPLWRGQGLGSQLIRYTLGACDRLQMPVYLEATSPRNVRLYARHGFEVVGAFRTRSSPPILAMRREPHPVFRRERCSTSVPSRG